MKKLLSLSPLFVTLLLSACSSSTGSGEHYSSGNITQSAEKRTIIIPPTTVLGNLDDPDQLAQLLAEIESQSNLSGTCSNSSSSPCYKGTSASTVVGSFQQSYSSYAAIRTDYLDADGEAKNGIPANSFIGLVLNPTTNRNSVVDATYRGQVSYSRQNQPAIITRDTLTMTVKDDQISGVVTATTGSGTVNNVITFETADIITNSNSISFSGDAVFAARYFYSSNDYEGDIKGSYQGYFAGSNAEEVIGTFHSNNTGQLDVQDDPDSFSARTSVQGAFGATKQ